MRKAENKVADPIFKNPLSAFRYATAYGPKFEMVRIGEEVVTLAHIKVPKDSANLEKFANGEEYETTILVGGSLFNPNDGQINRQVGRSIALERLISYLNYGTVQRHKDGRNADHFLVEVTDEDVRKGGWHRMAAETILNGTYIGKAVQEESFLVDTSILENGFGLD